ncbi:Hypothetical protein A7982_09139 [Minicystis rosea]|nr:Hypothetical protein A7982_09139 [Minicystis rosea]
MARQSRPPGFDMTYRPERRVAFGPPLRQRLPSLAYLAFALAVCGVIVYGQHAPSGSTLFHYVVEGDRGRVVPSSVCAIILVTSAIASVLREQMRGVILHPEGIDVRELLSLGWPRVRRFHWSQIDRMFVPPAERETTKKTIRLDLWDGSQTWLPDVAKASELGVMLERVALARAIPIEGGTGLVDDLGNPLAGDE